MEKFKLDINRTKVAYNKTSTGEVRFSIFISAIIFTAVVILGGVLIAIPSTNKIFAYVFSVPYRWVPLLAIVVILQCLGCDWMSVKMQVRPYITRTLKINVEAEKKMKQMGFTEKIEMPYDLARGNKYRQKLIFVNKDAKKLGLIDYPKKELLIVNFDEIANCQIYTSDVRPKYRVVDYLLFFFTIFFPFRRTKIDVMELIVNLKDYETLQVKYEMVESPLKIEVGTAGYLNAIRGLQKAKAYIDLLLNEKQK